MGSGVSHSPIVLFDYIFGIDRIYIVIGFNNIDLIVCADIFFTLFSEALNQEYGITAGVLYLFWCFSFGHSLDICTHAHSSSFG